MSGLPGWGHSRGFVPTMGALHQGHMSLVSAAMETCEEVVVSIFVNPTQFGPNEDFNRYPRTLESDLSLCESAGVDWVFIPSVEAMYPSSPTMIHVPIVSDRWEGAYRPRHFDGVATVVSKLFNLVQPTHAFFGLKDLQQCMVIEKLVRDLNHRLELVFCETLREPSGLAMSSRNRYLSESELAVAPRLFECIKEICQVLDNNELLSKKLEEEKTKLRLAGFTLDYLEAVSLPELVPLLSVTRQAEDRRAVIVAARLGIRDLLIILFCLNKCLANLSTCGRH